MRILCLLFALVLLTGCASTKSVITEFGADGKIVKVTETTESVISTVVESTKNKTLIVWEDGLTGYISASAGTAEDPTPTGKIFVGKVNKGVISIHAEHKNLTDVAKVIIATKSNTSADFTGFKSESNTTQK